MDLILNRTLVSDEGIFGELMTPSKDFIACTLEHAFIQSQLAQQFYAKLPAGVYTCLRSQHQLHSSPAPFETFEVTDVPGHTGILFHTGNWNKDSDGCILLGEQYTTIEGEAVLMQSKRAFSAFMALQEGEDSFTLTVKDQ